MFEINSKDFFKDGSIRFKQKEKSSFINEINNVACRVETQHRLLNEFHRMKLELKTTKERVEECIEQRKQLYTEIHTKTTIESKKCIYFFYLIPIYYFLS